MIPLNWGMSYHFDFPANRFQIDMTGPNLEVLFAQTLICLLCNYYSYITIHDARIHLEHLVRFYFGIVYQWSGTGTLANYFQNELPNQVGWCISIFTI